jgi:transposase
MDLWSAIRKAWFNPSENERPSYAELSRKFGPDPRTIKKILAKPEPPGYQITHPRKLRKLEPHLDFIKEILDANPKARKKQRHTAQRIYERLCEERGYTGSARSVRKIVAALNQKHKEVFIPLAQPKSQSQVDFFEADIYLRNELTRVYVFVMSLSYSDAVFAMAFPFQKREAWLEGHKQAYIFFGGVPKSSLYDNDRSLVAKILSGHTRKVTEEFKRLQAFYSFEEHFCNAYSGHEKGIVENANKYIEGHFFTPYPRVNDFRELNIKLATWCRKYLATTAKGKTATRGELLADEQPMFLELPTGEFEACIKGERSSDSMSLVNFDTVRYSVPDELANRSGLIAKGFWDRVEIYTPEGKHLATHQRLWEKYKESLNPLHYLHTLESKPGALDHGRPFNELDLPACFQTLRKRLETEAELEAINSKLPDRKKGGSHVGTKKFVRILKLLKEFPLSRLRKAIEKSLRLGNPQYEVVRQYCYPQEHPDVSVFELAGREHLKVYEVKRPDLGSYDFMLNRKKEEVDNEQTTGFIRTLFEGAEVASDAAGLSEPGDRVFKEEEQLRTVPEVTLRAGTFGAGGEVIGTAAQGCKIPDTENDRGL